jgi:hypothetical protein
MSCKVFAVALTLLSCLLSQSDLGRLPPEVRYKVGYVNPHGKPKDFKSAMLWGIAIADSRVPGYENAEIEVAHIRFVCRADGHDFVLNDDTKSVRGGLYRRYPWFGTDAHEPMAIEHSSDGAVLLRVGRRADRVWHFWAASPRATLPVGHLEGCRVKMRVKVANGALLQVGFDYWREANVDYGNGGNNHEAGASGWYFPSTEWQEAAFSDITK